MNRIAKPNNVTAIGDWSWKEKAADNYSNRVCELAKPKMTRGMKRRYISAARKQAHLKLRSLGQPALVQLENRELVNRLCNAGVISGGPYGKKTASEALVNWYKSLLRKDKVSAKRTNDANSDSFLTSWEWTNLRYRVLLAHGRKCQCCGAAPPDVVLHVDHIKPRSKYPELALEFDNLQVLCAACNKGKSNLHEDDFREADK